MRPKLRFQLNKQLDRDIAWNIFREPTTGGVDFWRHIVELHEPLKTASDAPDPKAFIEGYVNRLYTGHKKDFQKRLKEIKELFGKRERALMAAIDGVFQSGEWPGGKYIVFPSVFDVNPRFLDTKTFQVFMYADDNGILFTIAHELLHFRFYDYCLRRQAGMFQGLDTEHDKFWDMAEIFNTLVQNSAAFLAVHGQPEPGYPDHGRQISDADITWTGRLDDWIERYAKKYLEKTARRTETG